LNGNFEEKLWSLITWAKMEGPQLRRPWQPLQTGSLAEWLPLTAHKPADLITPGLITEYYWSITGIVIPHSTRIIVFCENISP
jgi:hypothetical protein